MGRALRERRLGSSWSLSGFFLTLNKGFANECQGWHVGHQFLLLDTSSWGYLKAHYVHKSQSTLHSQDGYSEVLLPFLNLPLRLCDLQPGCWWPWAKSLNILSPSTEWWEQRELPGPMVHCEDELFPDAHKTLWVPLRGAWLLRSPGEFPSFVTKVELCFITLATHYILVTSQELAWSHM